MLAKAAKERSKKCTLLPLLFQVSVRSSASEAVPDTQMTHAVADIRNDAFATDEALSDGAPSAPKRRRPLSAQPQGLARNLQTLAGAKPKSYFDVACQVVAVFDYDEHVALRVWDGSLPRKG